MATNGKKSRKKIIIFLGSKREPVIQVQVEKAQKRTLTQVVTATGKIFPEVQVKISPEVSGEIVSLPVKEGQRVSRGQLLMKIKPDVYEAQRDQFAAGLARAKADLTKSELEFRRIETLFEKGLVSESEFVGARAGYESSKASYAQSRASLNQAEENLRKTTVLSPMDGTVSQLNSELGERVLGTVQFQGTDVMTIADLSKMEARVDVSENDVILVSIGDTARISVDAFPDRKVNAIVYEIANTGRSKGLGTQEEVTNFTVKMRVVDREVALRPGMSMTADVETETKSGVLAVPIQSVTTRMPKPEMKEGEQGAAEGQGATAPPQQVATAARRQERPKEIVFVVENGVVKAVQVKRGISNDSHVEVTEGVTEGMEVVSGTYRAINRELEDGSKVRVEEPKKQPGKPKGEGA